MGHIVLLAPSQAFLDLPLYALLRRQTPGVGRHLRAFQDFLHTVHFFKQVELTRPTKRVKDL